MFGDFASVNAQKPGNRADRVVHLGNCSSSRSPILHKTFVWVWDRTGQSPTLTCGHQFVSCWIQENLRLCIQNCFGNSSSSTKLVKCCPVNDGCFSKHVKYSHILHFKIDGPGSKLHSFRDMISQFHHIDSLYCTFRPYFAPQCFPAPKTM